MPNQFHPIKKLYVDRVKKSVTYLQWWAQPSKQQSSSSRQSTSFWPADQHVDMASTQVSSALAMTMGHLVGNSGSSLLSMAIEATKLGRPSPTMKAASAKIFIERAIAMGYLWATLSCNGKRETDCPRRCSRD